MMLNSQKKGVELLAAIRSRGWTQMEFARRLGASYVSVSYWVRGHVIPSAKWKRKITRLVGVRFENGKERS